MFKAPPEADDPAFVRRSSVPLLAPEITHTALVTLGMVSESVFALAQETGVSLMRPVALSSS